MNFSIKDFFSKCDQIRSAVRRDKQRIGGVYYSSSQSSELQDTWHVHQQEGKAKKQRNEHTEIARRIIRGYKAPKRSDPDKNYFVYTW